MANEYARISITLPHAELEAADRLAAERDRSRSWIIAEAIRRYVAESPAEADRSATLGESRRIQIGRDLELTAAERLRDGELVSPVGPPVSGAIEHPLRFTSYAEFAAWRARQSTTP